MDPPSPHVDAELVPETDPARFSHLAENRALIIRRALLATALGGALPVPVLDDYFASRVRTGMFMKLAQARNVGLPETAAEVLAESRDSSPLRNATITAATLIALKLAWRKFFALLAAGRGAEEAATVYQMGILFDHYCAKLHTGPPIDRARAKMLHKLMHKSVERTSKAILAAIFRDGGRILGRTALQAPGWINRHLAAQLERWIKTGGHPEKLPEPVPDESPENTRWLDRAVQAVEERLSILGNDYLTILLDRFECEFRAAKTEDPLPPRPQD